MHSIAYTVSNRFGYADIVLELAHTDASVTRYAADRVLSTDDSSVEWDARGGTRVNGKSTPIRPVDDDF